MNKGCIRVPTLLPGAKTESQSGAVLAFGFILLAAGGEPICKLADIRTAYAAHEAPSRRVVGVVTLASASDAGSLARLDKLVKASASFSRGMNGDVGGQYSYGTGPILVLPGE